MIDSVKVAVVMAIIIIAITCLIALPVMFLWNWVMPDIFGLTTINFKQALCLALLCKVLFGWKVKPSEKKE